MPTFPSPSRPRAGVPARRSAFAIATALAVVAQLALLAGLASAPAAFAAGTATVSVNTGTSLGTVPAAGEGVNTAIYDGDLNDAAIPGLLSSAGVDALRFPGGSESDVYNWQNNSVISGQGYANPNNTFDDFMGIANSTHAQPILTVNYGSGTASEAASWVTYANITKGYGVKYWEIGNETYGDGTYGSKWEYENNPLGATAYANNAATYISAMKAADPTIQPGVVLTTPGNWPDGLVASSYGDTADWNHTVLAKVASQIGFVIVHWYPNSTSESQLLGQDASIASMVSTVRSEINQYAGSNAANVKILVTETDAGYEQNSVPAALFAADADMAWLENGVTSVDWWDLHNGIGTTATDADGSLDYNDEGLLSNASCASSGSPCEPTADTPFNPYYGLKLAGQLAPAGSTMVSSTSNQALLAVHAVKTAGGGLNVMLINKDPANSYPVALNYTGFTAGNSPTIETFSDATKTITTTTGSSGSTVTVPPYSITVLKLTASSSSGGDTTPPSVPTGLASSNVTSSAVTLSWTASTDPNSTVAGYNVYRGSTKVATVTGTSYTDTGLTASTAYSYTVTAQDPSGNTSAASAPLSVTTAAASSGGGCTAAYAISSDWGAGFNANVTITNTGSTATKSWKVTWTWPGNQTITSMWNATYTQTGAAVTAGSMSYNNAIAPGATAGFGFGASYTGTNTAPKLTCTATN